MQKITLLIVWIIMAGMIPVVAQEFDVREFKAEPTDLSARRYEKRTVNNDVCALVKVVTNIEEMKFDSNIGIVEVEKKDEGYWVYIAPRERRIRLMAPGYLPLDVPMPEAAKSYVVYNMVVASIGVNASDMIPVNFIVDDHPDALLEIDGESFVLNQSVRLAKGKHQISISKAGYKTIEEEIEVNESSTLFRYQLEGLIEEVVTIRTSPEGAQVYINNVLKSGTTPIQEFLFPGTYSLRITLSEYKNVESEITVKENQTNEFSYKLDRYAGTLVLNVNPSNAKITINQRDYSRQKKLTLAPGIYRIIAESEGYYTTEERITIEEGQEKTLTLNLEEKTGSLRFVTNKVDANFTLVNSKGETVSQWKGLNQIREIPAGNYTYTGTLDGYADLKGSLAIFENQETQIDADFGDEQLLAYQMEQERIAAEKRAEEAKRKKEEQAKLRRQIEAEQAAKQEKKQKRKQWKTPDSYAGYAFTYSALDLSTTAFDQNFSSTLAGSFSIFLTGRFWGMNMNIGLGGLTLEQQLQDFYDVNSIKMTTWGISTGPKIGIGPIDLFAFAGYEANVLDSELFENEELSVSDLMAEFGAVFMPRKWSVGIKYSYAMPLGVLDGYPVFTRQEIGLVFK
ncbi:MAG: PEGA domain-containing protein [Bacteroidota bacterium]